VELLGNGGAAPLRRVEEAKENEKMEW